MDRDFLCLGSLERHFFFAWGAATEAAAAVAIGLGVTLGAQQLEPIDADHGLAALFTAVAVRPAVQLEAADDPEQGPFADVIGGRRLRPQRLSLIHI